MVDRMVAGSDGWPFEFIWVDDRTGCVIVSAMERIRASIDRLEPRRHLAVTTALHVNAGGSWYTDRSSRTFSPGTGFTGGHDAALSVATTRDTALYASVREGDHFIYSAPATNGRYSVFVEFAEDAAAQAGERVFDVTAEGESVADDLDPYARSGLEAFTIEHDITIADGTLDLSFDASVGEAFVSAIVLVPLDVPAAAAPYGRANLSESTRQAAALSGMLQIQQGLFFHLNNHRGFYPSSLAEAVDAGEVAYDRLANPRSDTLLPRGVLSTIEAAGWAANQDDYLFIRPGARGFTLDEDDITVYENPTRVSGDIIVAYGDGHVGVLSREDAAAQLGFDPNIAVTGAAPPPLGLSLDPAITQSQQKLDTLAVALNQYANEHSNRWPASLGVLVSAGYVTDRSLFSNPRLGANAAPPPPAGLNNADAAAWIDAHTDYALTRPNKSRGQASAYDPFLYEKPKGLADGLNVAIGNGTVQFRETRWAIESIAVQAGPIALDAQFDVDASAVRVGFSEDATLGLAAADLVVTNLGTGQVIDAASMQLAYDFATQMATFTFAGGTLPDGNYTATLAAGSVADPLNTPMAESASLGFFSLAADANHDRHVDFADLVIVAQNYGQLGRTFSQGNVNRDATGAVDFDDLVLLSQRYGQSLAPWSPVTIIAAPAAAAEKRKGGRAASSVL